MMRASFGPCCPHLSRSVHTTDNVSCQLCVLRSSRHRHAKLVAHRCHFRFPLRRKIGLSIIRKLTPPAPRLTRRQIACRTLLSCGARASPATTGLRKALERQAHRIRVFHVTKGGSPLRARTPVSALRLACHPDRPPAAASCPFRCCSRCVAFSGSIHMANAVHAVVPCSRTLTGVRFRGSPECPLSAPLQPRTWPNYGHCEAANVPEKQKIGSP